MTKLEADKLFPAPIWKLLATSIACNVPEDLVPTDKGMVDFIERCSVDIQG